MTKAERIAIVRVFVDLIKADTIVDVGEMEMYARLKKKYRLTREIERAAAGCSLSAALEILSESDLETRETVLEECAEMTVSDGFCATQEALLMIAFNNCLAESTVGSAEVLSIHNSDIAIEDNQVLYVECAYNDTVNAEIRHNYRQIFNEFRLAGLNFVYLPFVANHYQQYTHSTFKDVANFLAPSLSDKDVVNLIERLTNITTADFCCDQLCNRLGMQTLRDNGPSLLIKISDNYVNEQIFSNFLRIDVTGNVLALSQSIIDNYIGMLSTDALLIPKVEEAKGQFLYHGFYKQLFDMYTIKQGMVSTLVVDPYNGKIMLPEIELEIDGMRRKEKALYAMIISQTADGGVNFNLPKSALGKKAYDERMQHIKKLYGDWYSLFGGEREMAPNIEDPEIRNPMLSVIRKQINNLATHLKNIDDYNIRKDSDGNYTVPLDSKLIQLKHWVGE